MTARERETHEDQSILKQPAKLALRIDQEKKQTQANARQQERAGAKHSCQ